jgi:hypothetical protein
MQKYQYAHPQQGRAFFFIAAGRDRVRLLNKLKSLSNDGYYQRECKIQIYLRKNISESESLNIRSIRVPALCRKYSIGQSTCYRWKALYGGMSVREAQRLKHLPHPILGQMGEELSRRNRCPLGALAPRSIYFLTRFRIIQVQRA